MFAHQETSIKVSCEHAERHFVCIISYMLSLFNPLDPQASESSIVFYLLINNNNELENLIKYIRPIVCAETVMWNSHIRCQHGENEV